VCGWSARGASRSKSPALGISVRVAASAAAWPAVTGAIRRFATSRRSGLPLAVVRHGRYPGPWVRFDVMHPAHDTGHVSTPEEREESLARHPVRWSVIVGATWGLFMALASIVTAPLTGARFSNTFNLVFWLAAGLLFFGPGMVYGNVRRIRKRGTTDL
jgi:hypothetical protein